MNPIGKPVARQRLPRMIAGRARYVDDIALPRMLHAAVVRSPIPHGTLTRFDTDRARDLVTDIVTAENARKSLRPVMAAWRSPGLKGISHVIGDPHVRFAGQAIGLVLADDRPTAEDGRDLIDLEFNPLPAVIETADALSGDASLVYSEWDSNLAGTLALGSDIAACEAVFDSAPVVVERLFRLRPIVPNPMETRGIVADWADVREELTVWLSTQAPQDVRGQIAEALGLRLSQVRVITPDVGGAFGSKVHIYDDELLVCLAAVRTGRPVKWIEDRDEHLIATDHGRDAIHRARLALTDDGEFLAIATEITGNLGAYVSHSGIGPFFVSGGNIQGPYRFRHAAGVVKAVVTNTTPTGSYRGFGNSEVSFVRERLVDEAARRIGADPADLRLKNLVQPTEMPFQTCGFARYDSGDYPAALRMVQARVRDWVPPSGDGKRRGVGYGFGVEYTGLGPARDQMYIGFHVPGQESAEVEMHPDGTVTVMSALVDMGQGLETALAQLTAGTLEIPLSSVRVVLGDTALSQPSAGSMTSRSITVGGPAVRWAAEEIRDKLLAIAAHQLEADVEDLELRDGVVSVRGVADESRSVHQLARSAWLGWGLPEGTPAGLNASRTYAPTGTAFSYAAHAAAVAVDPETGEVQIENYWVAHDCGTVINPGIVEAQIHGAVMQGIGNALFEELHYGPDGVVTTSFAECHLPRSGDLPQITVDYIETPSPVTPGGMKGVGEGGTIVAVGTVGNAVAAAIPEASGSLLNTPLTPDAVWVALHSGDL
ncbi:xanthine dehydrogenase family protein molybdopterin-binding subunit [Kibdelosporangium aridum]|uniref:xanthine dehydrogenase family protein molybdopterin-binding subunit n=1 Tax=Kibdelosporangium aridum TaxID=2030 RepID=UPI000526C12B